MTVVLKSKCETTKLDGGYNEDYKTGMKLYDEMQERCFKFSTWYFLSFVLPQNKKNVKNSHEESIITKLTMPEMKFETSLNRNLIPT